MPRNTGERAGLQPALQVAPPGDRLRRWRKLHLAVDADTGEITAHVLTEGHAETPPKCRPCSGKPKG